MISCFNLGKTKNLAKLGCIIEEDESGYLDLWKSPWYRMKTDMENAPPKDVPPHKKMSAAHKPKPQLAPDRKRLGSSTKVVKGPSLSDLYFTVKSELLLSIKEDLELKLEIEALKQQFLETALVLAQYEGMDVNDLDIDKATRERCSLTKHIKSHLSKHSPIKRSASPMTTLGRPVSRNSSLRSHGKQSSEHYYGTKQLSARIQSHLSPDYTSNNAPNSGKENGEILLDLPQDYGKSSRDRLHVPDGHDSCTTFECADEVDFDSITIEVPQLIDVSAATRKAEDNLNNVTRIQETENSHRDIKKEMIRNTMHDKKLTNDMSPKQDGISNRGEKLPKGKINDSSISDSSSIVVKIPTRHAALSRTCSDPSQEVTKNRKRYFPNLNKLSEMIMTPRRGSVHDLLQVKSSSGVLVLYDTQTAVRENTGSDGSSDSSSDNEDDTAFQLDNVSSGSGDESQIMEYDIPQLTPIAKTENHPQNDSVLSDTVIDRSYQNDSNNTSYSANNEVAQILGMSNESHNWNHLEKSCDSQSQNSSLLQVSADSSGTTASILDYEQHMLHNGSSDDDESGIEAGNKPPLPPRNQRQLHQSHKGHNVSGKHCTKSKTDHKNSHLHNQNEWMPRNKNAFSADVGLNMADSQLSIENAELYDLDLQETARDDSHSWNESEPQIDTKENSDQATNKQGDGVSSSTCETEVECYDLDREYHSVYSSRTNIQKGVYVNAENKPKRTSRKHSTPRQSTSNVSSSDECNEPAWTINGFRSGKTAQVLRRLSSSRFSDVSSSFKSETQSSESASVGEPFSHKPKTTNSKYKPEPQLNETSRQVLPHNNSAMNSTKPNSLRPVPPSLPPTNSLATKAPRNKPDPKTYTNPPNGLTKLQDPNQDYKRHSSASDLSAADDTESVYTWTIQDDSDYQNIEDTFEENFQRIHQFEKDFRVSSTRSRVDKLLKQNVCPDHDLHMALGEPCTFLMGSDTMLSLLPEEIEDLESTLSTESPDIMDDVSQVTTFSDSELFSEDDSELIKLARHQRYSTPKSTSPRTPRSISNSSGQSSIRSNANINSSLEANQGSIQDIRTVISSESSPASVTLAVPMNSPTVSDSGNVSNSSSGLFKFNGKTPKQSTPKKMKKIRFQSPTREEKKTPKKEKSKKDASAKKEKTSKKESSKVVKHEPKKDLNRKVNKPTIQDHGGIWMGDDDGEADDKFGGVYTGDDDDNKFGGVYLGDDDNQKQSKPVFVNNNYKVSSANKISRNQYLPGGGDIYVQDDELALQREKKRALKQKIRQFTNVFTKHEHEKDVDLRTMGLL